MRTRYIVYLLVNIKLTATTNRYMSKRQTVSIELKGMKYICFVYDMQNTASNYCVCLFFQYLDLNFVSDR